MSLEIDPHQRFRETEEIARAIYINHPQGGVKWAWHMAEQYVIDGVERTLAFLKEQGLE